MTHSEKRESCVHTKGDYVGQISYLHDICCHIERKIFIAPRAAMECGGSVSIAYKHLLYCLKFVCCEQHNVGAVEAALPNRQFEPADVIENKITILIG